METERKVTRTRILLPRRRPDLLTRSRLINLLSDLVDKKLVLVTAPAGYGKTSLLVDFSNRTELPVCWYAIDPIDQDPQRFLAHFIASIKIKFPRFGQLAMAALNSVSSDTLDWGGVITPLVNDVYENIQEHFVIVLDDFHLVEGNKLIATFISRFCQDSDEACHVVIASRALVSLPDLTLMVARSQVDGLDFDALAFQPGEIQALFLQNYQRIIPDDLAQQLATQSEGWITGLLLSQQLLGKDSTAHIRVAHASGAGLADYFTQILLNQPAPIQEFLVYSSLMNEFDANLCSEVLGGILNHEGEGWETFLDHILQRNLFILPVGDEGLWLRYHHLFRDFLATRMQSEHPEDVRIIKHRLADSYSRRGDWERAFGLYTDLKDQEAMVGLIEQAGQSLITSGRWNVVDGWFNALLPGILADRPVVIALQAYLAVLRGDAARGIRLFEIAIPALLHVGTSEALILALVRRSGSFRLQGEYEAALSDAREALALADQGGASPYLRAEITRAIGLVYYQKGELNTALEWLNQALIAIQMANDEESLAKLLVDVGMTQRALGNYSSAKETYQRALDTLQTTANYNWRANLLNNLGVLQSTLGEYEEAVVNLEKALNYATMSSYPRVEAYALASIGDLYQILDANEEALDAYHRSRLLAESVNDGLLLIEIDLGETGVAGKQGDFDRANERLELAMHRAKSSGSLAEQASCQVEKGLLLIRQDQPLVAQSELEKAVSFYETSSNSIAAARAHLFLAAAIASTGALSEAMVHLERTLSLTRALDSYAYVAALGRQVRSELKKMEEAAPAGSWVLPLMREVKTFDRTLSKLRRRIRSRAMVVPFAGPQMHIFGLGSMKVIIDHNLISGSDWGTIIARDLFYLLLSHPEGLTKEAIGAIFWPDVGESDMKFRFKNNIYRLRRALGQDVIVLHEDLYYFNNTLDYEYDVESYQKAIEAAQTSNCLDEKVGHYQAALSLYKGPFLPYIDGNWALPEGERLVMSHLEALMALARIYLQNQQHTKALHCCQRALAEDACFEIAYRVIMQIYAMMGNRAAVTRQFKLCQKILKQEINMSPSVETITLYSSLIQ